MIVYHMSQTLALGDLLEADHERCSALSEPFLQALQRSEDCFCGMVLNAKYMYAVLVKYRMREWSNYAKWATEGAFEFIRRTEFPDACSRLKSSFFYEDVANSKKLFLYDWGSASEEEQQQVHLFEIEVDDPAPQKRDMNLYDQAYDAMEQTQDLSFVLACARRYFAGDHTDDPVWELMSDKPAKAVRDITPLLHE